MSLQWQLNNEAIAKLPKVSEAIKNAGTFEANQMTNFSVREICNTRVSIDNMCQSQINSLDDRIVESFKYKGWMNITY